VVSKESCNHTLLNHIKLWRLSRYKYEPCMTVEAV
jgi:hypothetical protein